MLPECAARDMAFLPYFPLANGLLTGKYRKGQAPPPGSRIATGWNEKLLTEENLTIVENLIAFAEQRGHTLLELAFSWLHSRAAVASIIAGATKPEQVTANAAAVEWAIPESDLEEIGRLTATR